MEATRHYIEVAGRRVFYSRIGSGPAVLLIHGSPDLLEAGDDYRMTERAGADRQQSARPAV